MGNGPTDRQTIQQVWKDKLDKWINYFLGGFCRSLYTKDVFFRIMFYQITLLFPENKLKIDP